MYLMCRPRDGRARAVDPIGMQMTCEIGDRRYRAGIRSWMTTVGVAFGGRRHARGDPAIGPVAKLC